MCEAVYKVVQRVSAVHVQGSYAVAEGKLFADVGFQQLMHIRQIHNDQSAPPQAGPDGTPLQHCNSLQLLLLHYFWHSCSLQEGPL